MNRSFADFTESPPVAPLSERTVTCPPPFSLTLAVPSNPYEGSPSVVWVLSRDTVGPGCPTGIVRAIASIAHLTPPAAAGALAPLTSEALEAIYREHRWSTRAVPEEPVSYKVNTPHGTGAPHRERADQIPRARRPSSNSTPTLPSTRARTLGLALVGFLLPLMTALAIDTALDEARPPTPSSRAASSSQFAAEMR